MLKNFLFPKYETLSVSITTLSMVIRVTLGILIFYPFKTVLQLNFKLLMSFAASQEYFATLSFAEM